MHAIKTVSPITFNLDSLLLNSKTNRSTFDNTDVLKAKGNINMTSSPLFYVQKGSRLLSKHERRHILHPKRLCGL